MPSTRFALLAPLAAAALTSLFGSTAFSRATQEPTASAANIAVLVPSATAAPAATATPPTTLTVPSDAAAEPPGTPANAPAAARGDPRDDVVRDAREAFARRDRAKLAALRAQAVAARHPLAPWVDYWELNGRLAEVGTDEVEAFYARWPGTYVEDRLRNDWLLELGRRRDWTAFARDYPRFRMNDDREVSCYALLVDRAAGKDVRDAARTAWLAQKDADDGCQLLAQTLHDDGSFTDADVWRRLRQAAEYGRLRAARAAAQILGKQALKDVNDVWDNPVRFLVRRGDLATTRRADLVTIALARMAASDPDAAALQMTTRWQSALQGPDAAWTWSVIAKQGAQSLDPDAVEWSERAWAALGPRADKAEKADKPGKADASDKPPTPDWGDDALAWHARAALRAGTGKQRWRALERSIDAMGPAERADGAWVYWRAQAELALAKDGAAGEPARAEARATLAALSTTLSFYGLLAAEDLGQPFALPPRPQPLTPQERGGARADPGLQRALELVTLGLRDEGRREWNYTLRGMDDRQLLAAAQWACDNADWQFCINTSERTKVEIDLAQRYPMPFQRDITAAAQGVGLEPAFVFGLIRQETRFMGQLRSHVGAAGLMQVMPTTAQWAARKAGIAWRPELLNDNATNLRIGTFYLKMVLDSLGGSDPMAAAAYNAGPARPRRWRGGLMLDPAVWTENVPFFETRDYVKKVMTNAAVYAALQGGGAPRLRPRLGPRIGPKDAEQPPVADMP